MQGVNPAAIRKKKKGEVEMETVKTGEMPVLKSLGPASNPVLKSKGPAENKQPETEIEIELLLNSAKKKKK